MPGIVRLILNPTANLGRAWQENLFMLTMRAGGGFQITPRASGQEGLRDSSGIRPISVLPSAIQTFYPTSE